MPEAYDPSGESEKKDLTYETRVRIEEHLEEILANSGIITPLDLLVSRLAIDPEFVKASKGELVDFTIVKPMPAIAEKCPWTYLLSYTEEGRADFKKVLFIKGLNAPVFIFDREENRGVNRTTMTESEGSRLLFDVRSITTPLGQVRGRAAG